MVMSCRETSVPTSVNDEELVRRARTGNLRATEQLLAKYRPLVENKARTYFLLGADHDDVVQEGMIGLFKAIRDFRDDRLAHFRAFADLCVTRQIVTAVKMATRQKHVPLNAYVSLHYSTENDLDADTTLLECLADDQANTPESRLFQQREMNGQLDAIRQMLSTLEQQVLECYLQGKTYREMAVELSCLPKAVDNALQRVKRKIGETMGG